MAQVAADQVVGAGRLGAFQEHVVFWIGTNEKVRHGLKNKGRTLYLFDDLSLHTFRKAKFWSRENFGILPKNRRRDIELKFSVQSEAKNLRL